jgi:ribosomal protein S18 acetylase RimI-like enzyme
LNQNTAQNSSIVIRAARPDDLPTLVELTVQLGYPTQVASLEARLQEVSADATQMVFVAEGPDGRPIGWVHVLRQMYFETEPFAEIGGLVIAEQQRGLGAGRALMQAAEAWALQQGLQSVRLRSNATRTGAQAFYRRIGYEVEKTQTAFFKQLSIDE